MWSSPPLKCCAYSKSVFIKKIKPPKRRLCKLSGAPERQWLTHIRSGQAQRFYSPIFWHVPGHASFPMGNCHFPLAKLGLRKQNSIYRNRHASTSRNFLGLSCKVFKRTEYRECVLIGNCHWLGVFILFVAWVSECSNLFIFPLLAIVFTEVNVLILGKTLYYKISSPKIKVIKLLIFMHYPEQLSFTVYHAPNWPRSCPGTKEKEKRHFLLNPHSLYHVFQRTVLACLWSTWAGAILLSELISIQNFCQQRVFFFFFARIGLSWFRFLYHRERILYVSFSGFCSCTPFSQINLTSVF